MFVYENLSLTRKSFIDKAIQLYPDISGEITRDQIKETMSRFGLTFPQWLCVPENKKAKNTFGFPTINGNINMITETDEEINIRINEKYESMETLVEAVSANSVNSLIVAGAPGLGKSFTVNKVLNRVNSGEYGYVFHRGYLKATHLFRLLWENKGKEQVIVIDDCDSIFEDQTALNLLKAALELKSVRRIGWGSEKEFFDQDGDSIPRYFDYEGSIIFLTNLAFHELIDSKSKNAPHLSALESRSLVLDLGIRTKREYMIKIKQTVNSGMLRDKGISKSAEMDILAFMDDNVDKLRELSLRMCEKIASLYLLDSDKWRTLAKTVCCR